LNRRHSRSSFRYSPGATPTPLLDRALRESQNTNTAPTALSGDAAVDFQRIGAEGPDHDHFKRSEPYASGQTSGFGLAGV
jgi:hypothetical protein